MNDIRFRIGTAAGLSFIAWYSIYGALFTVIWWIAFTRRFRAMPRLSFFTGSLSFIIAIALILQLLQGTGIMYGFRMGAILLVAAWLWSEYRPGEMLDLTVWLMGDRLGFDLGLVAELSIQGLESFVDDLERMRTAWSIKGLRVTTSLIPAAGMFLVRKALLRAHDTGELLAVRGYRQGGTICPSFSTPASDIVAAAAALIACVIVLNLR